MAHDLAERIVTEASVLRDAAERAACMVCRIIIVCDAYNVHRDELLMRPHHDGRMSIHYKTLRWPLLTPEETAQVVRLIIVSAFGIASNRYGAAEHVELQLEHGGAMLIHIPWGSCGDLSVEDLVTGDPIAERMLQHMCSSAMMAVRGLLPMQAAGAVGNT